LLVLTEASQFWFLCSIIALAKGKGGKAAQELLRDIPQLELILLTTPFFYSNFLAFFAPLPNDGKTQWELCASFGPGSTQIDMMSVSDLGRAVVSVSQNPSLYNGRNLRIASERISMDEIASNFSDLYGKDVIYNPLLPKELAEMEFSSAPAMAQMCQFLGSKSTALNLEHDMKLTEQILKPRAPTKFSSWLLTHSDASAFSRVGLDLDTPDLTKICVFGALSSQGKSVVKGLLADSRKSYVIRCTTRKDLKSPEVQEIIQWDPKRVSFVQADFDDLPSCKAAVTDMDGAFLVADLQETRIAENIDPEVEESHARNIIDACEDHVKHLVFSTMEGSENVDTSLPHRELMELSPKARMAVYARSKKLSVTFVLMPCYSETFFHMMDVRNDGEGKERLILKFPSGDGDKIMCMSVDELGTAVAKIFDSYQCFAGHEIGLVTDFVTVSEVQAIFQDVFTEHTVETETVDTKDWVEATDTYMKDLGQMFAGLSDSKAISRRYSVAKTLQLVPTARNLKRWVEQNRDNPAFREKLGLR
jgi:nucleoside-diphosphate-sugar epimerase